MAVRPPTEGYDPVDTTVDTGGVAVVTVPVKLATETDPGAIALKGAAIADLVDPPTAADFNALLAQLRAAGVIATT